MNRVSISCSIASLVAGLAGLCGCTNLTASSAQAELQRKASLNATIAKASPDTDMPALLRLHEVDRRNVGSFYDLPWSTVRFERMESLNREWVRQLQDLDFDRLEQQDRIDYLLLRNGLASERARLALDRRRLAEMEELLPFRRAIQDLEQARWSMQPVDPQKAAGVVSAIPDQIKKLRKRIEKGKKAEAKKAPSKEASPSPEESSGGPAAESQDEPSSKDPSAKKEETGPPLKLSASLARRVALAVGDVRRTLKDWSGFYDGFVPEFSWWVKKPEQETVAALEDYAKFLREEIAGLKGKEEDPLVGDPIGAEALAQDLATEMIAYPPEALIAIAEAEFAWCQGRMQEAARELGLGKDWKAALAKVKNDFVPPGRQDGVILEKARHAIQFVKEHQLVTVPPLAEEVWRMTMISPDGQKTIPYAAYSGPNMLVAYAKDEMKHEDKLMSMRGNNPHFMHIVTPHELIPGHHLQQFMAERNRPYRQMFATPFYVEGWSLYWELMLWQHHYGETPEDRIGMLFWRMHRCARVIVSLKFHLGKMTPAEMVDFLVDRVGHERLGATSEVRRFIAGGYSPLYQCGYMIGGLQLRALRQELVE
ncbi:MAG TPA: DUF885 family protein, partial [Candidatus Binatia bacterium]|nr:DUF885 family protein [Candidatus Binatia bacterium]